MIRRHRHTALIALLLVIAVVPQLPAAGEAAGTRIYLLANDDGGLVWSTTPDDPEAAAGWISQVCGVRVPTPVSDQGQCRTFTDFGAGEHRHAFDFYPGALIDDAPHADGPVRFHFEIDVASQLPYTVHAVVDDEHAQYESDPATQVAPGVWEGAIDIPRPFSGEINLVGAAVRTQDPRTTIRVDTAGASWLELPHQLAARSVPDLLAADTYTPAPTMYEGGTRTVWLNDGDWSATSFEGDLTQTQTFDVSLDRDARMLLAWVDVFDSPPVYDALRGRPVDARRTENSPALRLLRGGSEVARGSNGGYTGQGSDALALLAVASGPLSIEVSPASWDPDGGGQELDYKVHVLAVHGPRSLARMRWSFAGPNDFAAPAVRGCSYGLHQVPVTDDVTTLAVDLHWDSAAVGAPDWTVRFDLLPFGELPCGTTGDTVRLTLPPRNEILYLGPVPEAHSLHVSQLDTVFEMDVSYTYRPVD
jgi:hypothetical protein